MQHFDGTVEEAGPEEWYTMGADPAVAPEDWSGSVDVNYEDLPGTARKQVRDWQTALEMIDDTHNRIIEFE